MSYKKAMRVIFPLAFTFFSACTTLPAPEAANNVNLSWQTRENELMQIPGWHINGAVAIQETNKATSASLTWDQRDKNNYTLLLQGPMGAGAAKVIGTPSEVTLTTGHQQTYVAKTPETLLAKQTGWNLPVSYLYYWVRGIPAPYLPAETTYDKYHHLTSLTQAGWQVNYLQYTAVGKLDLPTKITLEKKPFRLKLVISQWQLL